MSTFPTGYAGIPVAPELAERLRAFLDLALNTWVARQHRGCC